MKKILKITLLLLLVTAFSLSSACSGPFSPESEGSQPSVPAEQVAFLRVSAAGITTRAAGAPDPGTDDERKADVLHFYFYRITPADTTLVARREYMPATGTTYPYTVSVPMEVIHAGNVQMRVFASPDLGMDAPGLDALTPADFATISIPGMRTDGGDLAYTDTRFLPMTSAEFTGNFETPGAMDIELTRAVAKLRIRFTDHTDPAVVTLHRDDMSLQLTNLRIAATLLPAAEMDAGMSTDAMPVFDSQTFNSRAGAAFPFRPETTGTGVDAVLWDHTAYVNEHLFPVGGGAARHLMQLALNIPYTLAGGARVDENRYSLPLNFEILRNHIYMVTINVFGNGTGPVTATLETAVEDWGQSADTDHSTGI